MSLKARPMNPFSVAGGILALVCADTPTAYCRRITTWKMVERWIPRNRSGDLAVTVTVLMF